MKMMHKIMVARNLYNQHMNHDNNISDEMDTEMEAEISHADDGENYDGIDQAIAKDKDDNQNFETSNYQPRRSSRNAKQPSYYRDFVLLHDDTECNSDEWESNDQDDYHCEGDNEESSSDENHENSKYHKNNNRRNDSQPERRSKRISRRPDRLKL